jgi:hypothetical protein
MQHKANACPLAVDEISRQISDYMLELIVIKKEIDLANYDYNNELNGVVKKYSDQLRRLTSEYDDIEIKLLKVAKENKSVLFDNKDIYDTPYGRLIREISKKVVIPRNALQKCEELGFKEAIKIVKTIKRDVIEKWPDERLGLIGARREPTENIQYALMED